MLVPAKKKNQKLTPTSSLLAVLECQRHEPCVLVCTFSRGLRMREDHPVDLCLNFAKILVPVMATLILISSCRAESPFFVTYTSQMEEPRNLEIDTKSINGEPQGTNRFGATALEFEYGATAWWTTELYLDGQATASEGSLFTGYRWENRFRMLPRQHWINPVFYLEFENINGADKTLLEVVGHDGVDDFAEPNGIARQEKKREIETKLILASYYKGWTIAENIIAEKNLANEPWEFGYAVGVSRPLAMKARPDRCSFCPENFQVGVEMYGGLGTTALFGLAETSHYIAPSLAWSPGAGMTVRVSPNFGLTDTSARFLLRVGVSYEINQFGRSVQNFFRGGHK
jgi:hypothetical protein